MLNALLIKNPLIISIALASELPGSERATFALTNSTELLWTCGTNQGTVCLTDAQSNVLKILALQALNRSRTEEWSLSYLEIARQAVGRNVRDDEHAIFNTMRQHKYRILKAIKDSFKNQSLALSQEVVTMSSYANRIQINPLASVQEDTSTKSYANLALHSHPATFTAALSAHTWLPQPYVMRTEAGYGTGLVPTAQEWEEVMCAWRKKRIKRWFDQIKFGPN